MENTATLNNYADYFHDGTLINIAQEGDRIAFYIESAEVPPPDNIQDGKGISLSENNTIKGELSAEGVTSLKLNKKSLTGSLKMVCEDGEIHDLEIQPHKITLQIAWSNQLEKHLEQGFSVIEVEAKKILWESLPHLKTMQQAFAGENTQHSLIREHYHNLNGQANGRRNKYLDVNGLPVPQGSQGSYLWRGFAEKSERYQYKTDLSDALNEFIKYVEYFHDGAVINIIQTENNIFVDMISAEIEVAVNNGMIIVSKDGRLKGSLCFEEVQGVKFNGRAISTKLKMKYDTASIYALDITSPESAEISIIWESYHSHFSEHGMDHVQISANKIYWISKPELVDPFW